MNNDKGILNQDGDSVYPGNYVSLVKDEEIAKELNSVFDEVVIDFPVIITDLNDTLKIEIAIPGINREDFFIHDDENGLSVTVLHKNIKGNEASDVRFHHFGCMCFEKHIVLPENVDSEFISAEYADGILCLHLSKTKKVIRNSYSKIAVY